MKSRRPRITAPMEGDFVFCMLDCMYHITGKFDGLFNLAV